MTHLEIVVGALAYLSSIYSLSLVSWAAVRALLPATCHVGLRLAVVLTGQFAACAIVVQTLGLVGSLHRGTYLATTLLLAAAACWRSPGLQESFWRLVAATSNLWIRRTPLGLGYATAVLGTFLGFRRFAYVSGIDSLTIHGPLVLRWIQQGRVSLSTAWNYPQCWEYQYAPNFLLVRSDALVIVPSLLQITVLLLLVRELAARLGVPGKASALVSLLCVFNPVVWGGTMKNDPAFAIGLLLGLLALERLVRQRSGSGWMAQLACFVCLGTKPSGFAYVGLILGPYAVLWLLERSRAHFSSRRRELIWLGLASLLFQSSAAAVQLNNIIEHGSPTYPIALELGTRVLFDGPVDLRSTSILAAAGNLETWVLLSKGSATQIGLELPLLLISVLGFAAYVIAGLWRAWRRGRRPDRRLTAYFVMTAATAALWFLYLATPWSRGTHADPSQYIRAAESLRYAIAPVCLSYVLAAAFLTQLLGREVVWRLLGSTFLALVLVKWLPRRIWLGPLAVLLWKLLFVLAVFWSAVRVGTLCWRLSGRLASPARNMYRIAGSVLSIGLLVHAYVSRVESERDWRWEKNHRQIWTTVRNRVPDGSVIGTNLEQPLFGYFLAGARLQNRLRLAKPLRESDGLSYYYLFIKRADLREKALDAMRSMGWVPLVESPDHSGILLQRFPTATSVGSYPPGLAPG